MPASRKPSISEIVDVVESGVRLIEAADDASDLLRSARSLRRRAEEATRKAETAKTRLGRAWWLWRADRLNDRADKLEHRAG